ncbi:MAG TPA: hypothetical protein DDZ36_09935, partial [Deltaproteobacteria bacterium]|nr:hypothetical protein [Deltaproteobacteria bacterium]
RSSENGTPSCWSFLLSGSGIRFPKLSLEVITPGQETGEAWHSPELAGGVFSDSFCWDGCLRVFLWLSFFLVT